MTYSSSGTFDVSLKAINGSKSETETKVAYITVGDEGSSDRPSITSTTPSNNASNVAVSTKIEIEFDQDLDNSTVNSNTVQLEANGSPVTVSISLSGGKTIVVTPTGGLNGGNTTYKVSIISVKNLAGIESSPSTSPLSFTFTTKNTSPSVSSSNPSENATGIAIDKDKLTVTFSSSLDASTISTSTVKLFKGTTQITAQVSVSGSTITLSPSANLEEFVTSYTIEIASGIKDSKQNYTSGKIQINFKTEAVSELYYYSIRSVSNINFMAVKSSGDSYIIGYDLNGNNSTGQWQFEKIDATRYAIINRYMDGLASYQNSRLSAAGLDDGEPCQYNPRPSSSNYFTGQYWKVIDAGTSNSFGDHYYIYADIAEGYLAGNGWDVKVTNSPNNDIYKFALARKGSVN